jgi:hypothetical protein
MPLFELTHPPPSRPAVDDEIVKDLELIVYILTVDPEGRLSPEDSLGPLSPIVSRWIAVCETKLLLHEVQRIDGITIEGKRADSRTNDIARTGTSLCLL